MTTIYHGTPLTPRAALLNICHGRAMCVSFFRPDDVEAVEAISPAVMFRQRRVFILAASPSLRRGMGIGARLDALLRMVGTKAVPSRPVGGDPGHAGCSLANERRAAQRLALRRQ